MDRTYQVPKEQARVELDIPPGPAVPAVIFLSAFAEHHHGQETVSDLFRASAPFLPVRDGEGRPALIRKKAVRWVRIEEPERVEWIYYELKAGAPKTRIRAHFADGDALEGDLFATTPAGHQRVSDVINLTGPFIHMESEEGVYLVNLGHVSAVRMVEEAVGDAR